MTWDMYPDAAVQYLLNHGKPKETPTDAPLCADGRCQEPVEPVDREVVEKSGEDGAGDES